MYKMASYESVHRSRVYTVIPGVYPGPKRSRTGSGSDPNDVREARELARTMHQNNSNQTKEQHI